MATISPQVKFLGPRYKITPIIKEKNNLAGYPQKIDNAVNKVIDQKNSSYTNDQNDKNSLDLLALTQDFNDNIL